MTCANNSVCVAIADRSVDDKMACLAKMSATPGCIPSSGRVMKMDIDGMDQAAPMRNIMFVPYPWWWAPGRWTVCNVCHLC